MQQDNQNNRTGKLTESDIDRIAKKVLQSEQVFGQAKDFFAGLKGYYTGRGYLPSKFSSALERVGKSFMEDWEEQTNLIKILYNLREKIRNSSMEQKNKNIFQGKIDRLIQAREKYRDGILDFLEGIKD